MEDKNIPLFKVHMPESAVEAATATLRSGFVAGGAKAAKFETEFGAFIGNKNVVATNCGSSALLLALYLSGVKAGDEIICAPMTCNAVSESAYQTGAKIVWADIAKDAGNISPASIESKITLKTKAILFSHWCGRLANIDAIKAIAEKHNLKVIEDAANAIGAIWQGKKIGNHFDYTTFSFQAVKQITTGDGGMLALKSETEKERATLLCNHGNDRKAKRTPTSLGFDVFEVGWKYQMNDIAASIGLAQMSFLEEILAKSRKNAKLYDDLLANVPDLQILKEYHGAISSPWAYTILVERRDDFVKKLQEHKIGCSVAHMRGDKLTVFKELAADLPNLDYFYERFINIPVGWWVSEEDVKIICEIIKSGW